jgi:hypothetical protein
MLCEPAGLAGCRLDGPSFIQLRNAVGTAVTRATRPIPDILKPLPSGSTVEQAALSRSLSRRHAGQALVLACQWRAEAPQCGQVPDGAGELERVRIPKARMLASGWDVYHGRLFSLFDIDLKKSAQRLADECARFIGRNVVSLIGEVLHI